MKLKENFPQVSVKVWGCKAMKEAQNLGEEREEGKRRGEGDAQVDKNIV